MALERVFEPEVGTTEGLIRIDPDQVEQFFALQERIAEVKQRLKELEEGILSPLRLEHEVLEGSFLELMKEHSLRSLDVNGLRVRIQTNTRKSFRTKTEKYLTSEELAEVMMVTVTEHVKVTRKEVYDS